MTVPILLPQDPPSTSQPPTFENTTALLRWLYEDLSRFPLVASPDVILHRADRSLSPAIQPLIGIPAVQAHGAAFMTASGGAFKMEIESVSANEWFGSVLGTLKIGSDGKGGYGLEMPACGVWKFEGGKVVEHWENVRDAEAFGKFFGERGMGGAESG